jgi:NAD(P)-dependent dehydrogenase (short-subunit alcohol dehydrogenase family)
MMLRDKVAVIYGAGGGIGGAVARAFASEGAGLFVTGRRLAPVEAVAEDVVSAGGSAEAAEVDALDERAIDEHLRSVIEMAGRVDISFNAVGMPDAEILGVPLLELGAGQFALPIAAYTSSYFLTARLAARWMVANRSGVIMTVTALLSRTGVPETRTLREAFEPRAEASGLTWERWQEALASRTHPKRLMTLEEMASAAAFMASDRASGMTGTTVNLTMGSLDD